MESGGREHRARFPRRRTGKLFAGHSRRFPTIFYWVTENLRVCIYVLVTLYFIKDFLDRDFGTFRVGVIPTSQPEQPEASGATASSEE
jgi:hypothetical protein